MLNPAGRSQYIHIETYAKKPKLLKQSSSDKKKGIRRRNPSYHGIFGEVERKKGFHDHIDNPEEPTLIYGILPSNLEHNIDTMLRESKKKAKQYREDTPVLIAGTASYPISLIEFNNKGIDVKKDEIFIKWLYETKVFLEKEFGESLKSVVLHLDEAHPHVHFYCTQELDEDYKLGIRDIHPGFKLQKKRKSKALKVKNEGLKNFANEYHSIVSSQFDMNRYEGKRERLTREEYKEVQKRQEKLRDELSKKETERKEAEIKLRKKEMSHYNEVLEKDKIIEDIKEENSLLKKLVDSLQDKIKMLKSWIGVEDHKPKEVQEPKPKAGEFERKTIFLKKENDEEKSFYEKQLNQFNKKHKIKRYHNNEPELNF